MYTKGGSITHFFFSFQARTLSSPFTHERTVHHHPFFFFHAERRPSSAESARAQERSRRAVVVCFSSFVDVRAARVVGVPHHGRGCKEFEECLDRDEWRLRSLEGRRRGGRGETETKEEEGSDRGRPTRAEEVAFGGSETVRTKKENVVPSAERAWIVRFFFFRVSFLLFLHILCTILSLSVCVSNAWNLWKNSD